MTEPPRRDSKPFDEHQREVASWMGYPDAAAMNAEHDKLHAALSEWLGAPSNALREARGEHLSPADQHLAWLEEHAVLHLQRYITQAGAKIP